MVYDDCDDPDCERLKKVIETPAFKELIEKVKNRKIRNYYEFSTTTESKLWVKEGTLYNHRESIGKIYYNILKEYSAVGIQDTRNAFRTFMDNLEDKRLQKYFMGILKNEFDLTDNFLGGSVEYPDLKRMKDKAMKRRDIIKEVIAKYKKAINPKWKPDKVAKKVKKFLKIKFQGYYDPLPNHMRNNTLKF